MHLDQGRDVAIESKDVSTKTLSLTLAVEVVTDVSDSSKVLKVKGIVYA
jgi:hypothetical protein